MTRSNIVAVLCYENETYDVSNYLVPDEFGGGDLITGDMGVPVFLGEDDCWQCVAGYEDEAALFLDAVFSPEQETDKIYCYWCFFPVDKKDAILVGHDGIRDMFWCGCEEEV